MKLSKVFSCVLGVHRAVFMFGHLRDPCLNVRMIWSGNTVFILPMSRHQNARVQCFRLREACSCVSRSSIREKPSDSRGFLCTLWAAPFRATFNCVTFAAQAASARPVLSFPIKGSHIQDRKLAHPLVRSTPASPPAKPIATFRDHRRAVSFEVLEVQHNTLVGAIAQADFCAAGFE